MKSFTGNIKSILLFGALILVGYSVWGQNYSWTEIEDFPGLERDDAIAFGIDNAIYIGSGNHSGFAQSNRFYKYDLLTETWSEVETFPGMARQYAIVEVLNSKAYLVGGIDLFGSALDDVWEYDPVADTWTYLGIFPGGKRWQAASFVIDNELYYGTGRDWDLFYDDLWKYDAVNNEWLELASLPKTPCYETVSFSVYKKGFIGLGRDSSGTFLNDIWSYDVKTDQWVQKSNFPGEARYYSKAQSYGNTAFVATGENETGEMFNDAYGYDYFTDRWQQLPNLPGPKKKGLASCSIPNQGVFFICGISDVFARLKTIYQLNIVWEHWEPFNYYFNSLEEQVYVTNLIEEEELIVFDLSGKILYQSNPELGYDQFSVAGWAPGVYIINYGRTSEKIVIYD